MPILKDSEFGQVTLRRSRLASVVRLKLDARGVISVSMPMRAPLYIAKQLLNESRQHLRKLLADVRAKRPSYRDGQLIGKSHRLRFELAKSYNYRLEQSSLVIERPAAYKQDQLEQTLQRGMNKALRVQAKAYLPRRLRHLASEYDFSYQKVRLSSAGTRWGSCSSQGTVSLNIWLMQLPFELIDYVLLHELCHTRYMNHSPAFWAELTRYCPGYKALRRRLHSYHPHA
jgi:predicted metal-dependent hydrolase